MMRNKISAATLAAALLFAPLTSALAAHTFNSPAAPASVQDDEPTDAEQNMFTKAQNFYIQGRYEQSAVILRDFLKTYPNSVITDLTLLWLGRSYMQLGRLPDAEQVGQRLRAIRDTPFIDIYESELQVAREAARNAPAVTPTQTVAATTPTTQPVQVAVARPTPTPVPLTRQPTTATTRTPTLRIRPTPTPVPTPSVSAASERRASRAAERVRRANARPTPTPTPEEIASVSSNVNANRSLAVPSTPTRRTPASRRQQANANREVASNRTTPARTPLRTPVVTASPLPPVVTSSDPALSRSTTTAPLPTTTTTPNEPPPPSSGSLSITVKQVPNLRLALRRASLAASPGQPVQLPLTVTNTGNKEDQFRLETDLLAEYQPTFSLEQGGTDTGLPILITPMMPRGASMDILLNVRIPDAAPDNQQRPFFVRAASQSDPQIFQVTDALLTVVAASLTASATVSEETVMPGGTFTQTISVRNLGSAAARNARADFVFNPEFELVSATPSPLVYDRASRTAIWSLGELDSRANRDITVTLRALPDALATKRALGRGTMRTASLIVPSNFDGPSVQIGRVTRARIDAVSTGLTATPGDTVFIPFVVRNPGNYSESFDVRITAPGAPAATVYADSNGDGRHQDNELAVTQTGQLDPRGGQYPLLLRVDIPRSTLDRQQYAYNVVVRSLSSSGIASEASTVLTVAAPRVRVRTEQVTTDVAPGDTFFYRLVLVNDGGGLAKNLVVSETLPGALEFVSSDPSLSTTDAAGGAQRFVWRVTELSPGDTSVLLVTVRLRAGVQADTTLTPMHTLTYQDTNTNSYTGQ
ncbi:MAG TPA: hypothetical protein VNA19_08545 [Pyrinomonadaceae bacterium]|nr:hypothetical protein [Pyrinomonadaceae bacterium]